MIDDIGRPGRPMADYVRVIRRGWWIVLTTLVLVTAVTYFISSRQAPLFQATAQATEAAITNALLAAETTTGANDLRIFAMPVDRMLEAEAPWLPRFSR